MMKDKLEKANIAALQDLREVARIVDVRFAACKMRVDMMGFTWDDFLEGVTIQAAKDCKVLMNT